VVDVQPEELRALAWAFLYFFCLLSSYYILRPLRDEMGIAGGVQHLQWVFTGTFLAMLAIVPVFGAVTSRFQLRKALPLIYLFFVGNILIFFFLFRALGSPTALTVAFFIWTSVFNLFVISVFWSFMTDIFSNEQAHRLFGFVAAGGSAGALAGPGITALLAIPLGADNLLLISAGLLGFAILCIQRLLHWTQTVEDTIGTAADTLPEEPPEPGFAENGVWSRSLGGGWLDGIRLVTKSPYLLGICLFILLTATLRTFLYFTQAHIVQGAFADPARRTTLFALMDLGVNVLTIFLQVIVTGRLLSRFGVPVALSLVPLFVILSLTGLGLAPILPILVAAQIGTRAGNYSLIRPGREVLFTVVRRDEKYKAKNFIDTVIFRFGDAASGWVFAGITGVGLGLTGAAFIGIPLAAVWLGAGYLLGKRQEALRDESGEVLVPITQVTETMDT